MKQEINKLLDNINGYPLDEKQRKVVTSNQKHILVSAGAGSGKTLTIIGKIGYLIEIQDEALSRYVYLVDSKDKDNQQLLEYFKFKGEESYDSVINGDDTSNLDRLYNKFIEMGLNV